MIGALLAMNTSVFAQELFKMSSEETRWISPENPTGERGGGGKTNHGAKGNAFIQVAPGETAILANIKGAGIIRRMWMSGTIPRSPEQRRAVRIQMFWDGAKKPAVDCPIGDFFCSGLGLLTKFENALFSSPEARSYNCNVPMPYKTSAKMQIVNESESYLLVWYDINFSIVKQQPEDMLYFHTAWSREPKTKLGRDFEILPRVVGHGRFIGTNIGVIGNPDYNGTWFGEGEVKVYLDGDNKRPTLNGTGTEDYIGSGWGQGAFAGQQFGSLVSDEKNDIYAFYRFHLSDPIYFHKDCRVTIQQIGNTSSGRVKEMIKKGIPVQPLLVLDGLEGDIFNLRNAPVIHRLLDEKGLPEFTDPKHPEGGTNFYRSDDVSATAYFYLGTASSNLPPLAPVKDRLAGLNEHVWSKTKG
jgi:hypothetical protein